MSGWQDEPRDPRIPRAAEPGAKTEPWWETPLITLAVALVLFSPLILERLF